eukprot:TRINITY_DN8268_c2_g1_i13.p1 TRINITY_DN8268_c2_g1~~TRINITY_DN8268_c2_g1_i13.p1  ORF type:complete len:342 (-),score=44.23 TRINITY_DN8268_c2_g1_i13:107-1132(-)
MIKLQSIFLIIQGYLHLQDGFAFQLTKVDPGLVSVQPGDSVSFKCAVDDHWEFCKFMTPKSEECDFEWKLIFNGVRKQRCAISERAEFYGDYNKKECGITITNVDPSDSGIWSCLIEEYILLGLRGSGNTVLGQFNLTVQEATTEAPTTPILSTDDKTDKDEITTMKEAATVTENDIQHGKDTTTEKLAEPKDVKIDDDGILVKQSVIPKSQEMETSESPPEAVPRIEEANSNLSAVIGVICAVAMIGIIGLAAIAFRKRQLSRQRPDASAAVVYDREARSVADERTMVGGQRNNYSIGGGNSTQSVNGSGAGSGDGGKNYHEYFPPNLSIQDATTTYNSV